MKILAVDDDEILLELLVETLRVSGFQEVTTATSAKQALGLIAPPDGNLSDSDNDTFDCFLLDIQMPGMDGIALCERIRENQKYLRTPIVMLTAMSNRSFVTNAFSKGATDYITKPFDTFELTSRLRLANMLVLEQKSTQQGHHKTNSGAFPTSVSQSAGFDDAISIEGVPGVVDFLVLENYLLQLSRGKAYKTMAISFKVVEAEAAYSNLSDHEFYELLKDCASAITANLNSGHCLLSYLGSGYFVCVADRTNSDFNGELAAKVQKTLKRMRFGHSVPAPGIAVGSVSKNSVTSYKDVHSMLLDAVCQNGSDTQINGLVAGSPKYRDARRRLAI